VLKRPADCSNVCPLAPEEYVRLARKLHVKFMGPPTPSGPHTPHTTFSMSSRRSLDLASSTHRLSLAHYLPQSERLVLTVSESAAAESAPAPAAPPVIGPAPESESGPGPEAPN